MIIKGKSRADPAALAAHLGNAEKNERVTLLETKGTVAQDLRGALVEMDAYAAGTHCEKSLYHGAISPSPSYRLTVEQMIECVDAMEEKLGLQGHARLIVLHEYKGRTHIHPVWARIDLNTMKAVSDSHNYRKHEEVARDLERRFGHERVQGAHHEREGVERPDRTPSRAELRQEERTGIKGKDVKAKVTAAFQASDNADAFYAALDDAGFKLAKGDRRDFVIVDHKGGIHSLARRIDGVNAAELRAFMSSIDLQIVPKATDVREELRRKAEAHAQAKLEKGYSRSDDYVSQTQAALKDHIARQKKIEGAASRDHAWDRIERGEKERGKRSLSDKPTVKSKDDKRLKGILEDHDRDRRREKQKDEAAPSTRSKDPLSLGNVEMTEAKQKRVDRLADGEGGRTSNRDVDKPDRQREAPGGGRSRSR